MPLNLSTFFKRLGSAIVFVAIMLTGLLWNEWTFLGLVWLIQALCLRDYFRIIRHIDKETHQPMWLQVVIQVTGFLLVFLFALKSDKQIDHIVWAVGGLLPVLPALVLLVSTLSKKDSFLASLQSFGGLFYITLPMVFLMEMRMQDMVLPLALILMIWCNDTMAYLVGSFIGKTPFSSISPKKTWEGTIGGAVLTIIGACLYGYFSRTYRLIDWVPLALCVTVAGSFGDLLESKLKRMADLKDSGTLMPGHGGALDRFDSLLIAVPFAFVYINYFMR
ncbi:MAG: phosphatidate cytidylyltransferase [Chitinophagales bacterium]